MREQEEAFSLGMQNVMFAFVAVLSGVIIAVATLIGEVSFGVAKNAFSQSYALLVRNWLVMINRAVYKSDVGNGA